MPSLLRRTPPEISTDLLKGKTTMLLGAPYIGKSKAAENLEFHTVENLAAAFDYDLGKGVVIDDFYTAVQVASDDAARSFPDWVTDREDVCITIRPRDLDWLLSVPDSEVPLSADLLTAFDQIVFCEYGIDDTEGPDRKDTAVDVCLDIGANPDTAGSIDTAAIEDQINQIRYPEYKFDTNALSEILGVDRYGPTYIPPLIVYLSDRDLERAVLTEQVVETVRSMGRNLPHEVGVASVVNATKDITSNLLDRGRELVSDPGLLLSGSAVVGSTPFVGAAGLTLWALTMDDDDPPIGEIFDRILEEELVPPAKERIEIALDLPPRTLDNLQELGHPANFDRIERLYSSLDEIGATELAEFEEAIQETETRIDQLESLVGEIEQKAAEREEYAELIAQSIATATDSRADFADELVRAESDLLNATPTAIDIDDVVDTYAGKEPEQIAQAARQSDLVILRGGLGTGKTTASYIASEQLEAAGYTPTFPNFEGRSKEFIEHNVRSSLDSNTAPILFVNYRSGAYPFTSQDELQTLIEWTRTDLCECVVIECREEQYRNLDKLSMRATSERSRSGAVWRGREEIQFGSFDDTETVQTVLVDVLRSYTDEKLDADRIAELVEWADGNVEVAKLVAAHERSSDALVNEYNSVFELLWDDVKGIIGADDDCAWVFRHVCAARSIETRALREVAGNLPIDRLLICVDDLAEYLGGDVRRSIADAEGLPSLDDDDLWTISPEIYADAVFKHDAIYRDNLLKYLSSYVDYEWYGLYNGVANGLGRAYSSTMSPDTFHTDDREYQSKVIEQTERFLTHLVEADLPPVVRFSTLRSLEIAYVPLPETVLTSHTEALVEGAETYGQQFDTEQSGEWLDFVGGAVVNRVVADGEAPISYDTLATCAEHADGVFHHEIANIFAYANGAVIRYQSDLPVDDVERVFDIINRYAHIAAQDERLDVSPHWFLTNYYSYLASTIFEQYDEIEDSALSDVLELLFTRIQRTEAAFDWQSHNFIEITSAGMLTSLTKVTDSPNSHDGVKSMLSQIEGWLESQRSKTGFGETNVVRVFSDAMKMLAGWYDDPDIAQTWMEFFETRALECADISAEEALMELYATALKRIVVGYHLPDHHTEIQTLEPWLDAFEHQLVQRGAGDDIKTARLLFNTFANIQLRTLTDGSADQEEVRTCLELMDRRARQLADERVHQSSAAKFLADYYSTVLIGLFEKQQDPTAPEVRVCLEVIPQQLLQSAVSVTDTPLEVVGTTYGSFLTSDEILHADSESTQEWLDALANARRDACDAVSAEISVFDVETVVHSGVYQNLIREFETPDVDPLDTWLPVFHERTWRAAETQSTHPSGIALCKVYGHALGTTARRYPDDTANDDGWIAHLLNYLRDAGCRDETILPPAVVLPNAISRATPIAWEFLPEPRSPATSAWIQRLDTALEATLDHPAIEAEPDDVRATTLAYTTEESRRKEGRDEDWTAAFIHTVLARLPPELYETYYSRWIEAWTQADGDQVGFLRICGDVLPRVLGSEPVFDDRARRVDLLARVFADFGYWADTKADITDSDQFYTLLSPIGSVVQEDLNWALDLLDAIAERVAEGEVGSWLHPEEVDRNARETTKARLLAAAYPHLLTSIQRLDVDSGTQTAYTREVLDDAIDRLEAIEQDSEWVIFGIARLLNAANDVRDSQAFAEQIVQYVRDERSEDVLTNVYTYALREVRDGNMIDSCRTLSGLYHGRETVAEESDLNQKMLAAGVGYAASIKLADDRDDEEAASLIAELDSHRGELSPSAVELLDRLQGDAEAESQSADPPERAESDVATLEREAYEALGDRLSSAQSVDYSPRQVVRMYTDALAANIQGEVRNAIDRYYSVWMAREQLPEDSDAFRHCFEAGIRLQAYGELINLDPEVTVEEETVPVYRDRLATPVVRLYDYLTGAADRPDEENILSDIDPSSDRLSLYELQRLATVVILRQLDSNDESPTAEANQGDGVSEEEVADIKETFRDGLQLIQDRDFATAVDQFDTMWKRRQDTPEAIHEVTANAGVLYAALIHDDPILSNHYERILDELQEISDRIPEPYIAVYERLHNDDTSEKAESDQLTTLAEEDDDHAELEREACRIVLERLG
jgi:hypothetical protein